MQPGQSDDGAETATTREVERDNLVLSGAVEMTVSAKRNPRGLRNSNWQRLRRRRTRAQAARSPGSYSRTVVTASSARKGARSATTTLPFGATVRSRGLSSGSSTSRTAPVRSPEKVTIVSSPLPSGPVPEERNSLPSALNPNPRGKKGTIPGGRTCSPELFKIGRQRQDSPSVA